MRGKVLLFIFSGIAGSISGQEKSIGNVLEKLNSNKIPYIYPQEAKTDKNTIFLDAREWEEYAVSKIPGAIYVGFKSFDIKNIKKQIPDHDKKIVVYCSIGVRSEKIGCKIKKAGYNNVFNLWGGIFEWKNEDKTVVDARGQPTEKVHVYSKKWGTYLNKGVKVY